VDCQENSHALFKKAKMSLWQNLLFFLCLVKRQLFFPKKFEKVVESSQKKAKTMPFSAQITGSLFLGFSLY
jgi:hypothetical protein